MVTRRTVLGSASAAVVGALAGCLGGDGGDGTTTTRTTTTTVDETTTGPEATTTSGETTTTAESTTTAPETTTAGGTPSIEDARAAYPDYSWSQLDGVDAVATTTVTLENTAFDPLSVVVTPGTTVQFVNEDGFGHSVTVPGLDVDRSLSGGAQTSVTFDEAGVYGYVCTFHPPDMLGKVVVTEGETTTPQTTTQEPAATVKVRSHPSLGDVLVGPDGMTLYMFDQDTQGATSSACSGGCADAWPPLTASGAPSAGDAVTAALDTFERASGETQVTAGGWPLYYFASDSSPGDAKGQGANDVWWVLAPDGTPRRAEPTDGGGGY